MNRPPVSFQPWLSTLRLFARRASAWLWNYFALNRPLNWPPLVYSAGPARGWRAAPQQIGPGGSSRVGISHFYLGILAGCFTTYFILGGELSSAGPLTAADYQSLAGIALALLLYPAVHRLGHFDDLRAVSGSLLVSGMFGFIVPLLVRILSG